MLYPKPNSSQPKI